MSFLLIGKKTGRLSLLFACWLALLGASSPLPLEYEVKAVYIYKLLKLIEWPDGFFSPGHDTVVIGVLGYTPVREAIEVLKSSHPIPIKIVHLESLRDISSIHVLFISSSAIEPLEDILKEAKAARCVTIGEAKDLAYLGAMINFVVHEGKVKFEINMKAMKDAGLMVSSRVLRAAIKVWQRQD